MGRCASLVCLCKHGNREDMNKVDMQGAELRARRNELHRYIKETAGLAGEQRNTVVDQLVEDELERLETLDWRLSRIKRRLQTQYKAAQAVLARQGP